MGISRFGRWCLLAGLALVLAACDQGAGRQDAGGPGLGGTPRYTGRDVEAPEIFEANEDGLWDGRPSLGGVWVAHPAVSDPQRVTILNKSNGETIVGALFRRERENPGPRIQISSDAAVELGILAGQPTPLRVVALKREEAPEPEPPAEAQPEAEAPAGEAAAASGPETVAEAPSAPAGAGDEVTAEPVPEDAPPTSFGRRRPSPAPEGAVDATAAVTEGAVAAAGASERDPAAAEPQPVPEVQPPTSFGRRRPRDAAEPDAVAPGAAEDITVAPLDGAAPEATAEARPAGPLDEPYIQAAIFGTEANANTAVEGLRAAGLLATVKEASRNDTTYWRVLVGPVASVADRDAMLEKVKVLGYRDAYPVSG